MRRVVILLNTLMKDFSRNIPPYQKEPSSASQRIAIFIIVSALIWLIYLYPFFILLFAIVAFWTVIFNLKEKKRLKKIAQYRVGESICSFTRALDYRHIDTWIIRAVWEELQEYVSHKEYGEFPIRSNDEIEKVFRIDLEELEFIAERVASRTSRTLKETQTNPYFRKVKTVEEFILFLNNQPKAPAV